MPRYKLTKGSLGLIIDGVNVDVEKGQTIELPEGEAKKYKHLKLTTPLVSKSELVNLLDSAQVAQTSMAIEIARDWSNVLNLKATEIITEVNKTDSVSDLEALYELEEKGQNRSGVLKSIEKRVAQLEGEV